MYEEMLGRPASAPEKKMLDAGFIPDIKFGQKVSTTSMGRLVIGKVDGIVLFAIPHFPGAPGAQLAWCFRIEGLDHFLPQKFLHPVEE
ncbi:tail protein [Escherichia phage 4MG]|uniref:Hyphothetical protein n=1 Tax=Escherichia phage 4MG TaxID=1391428 RepID=V5KSQ5_9CAUD|nr:tail protein [Escherichia phage 4MG]AGZ17715.1 hyphothetical protein [Escherichia phage 4MG]